MDQIPEVNMEKRLIVVLENAPFESVKIGGKFQLLHQCDHADILKKNGIDPDSWNPEMMHISLLHLFDSPLNRAGMLQVYVHTTKNILLEFNPETRIPRTFKRFAGLIVQLLHKLSVKDENGRKLIKVIKNPLTDHLPVSAPKIAISPLFKQIKPCKELVPNNDDPIVIAVRADDGEKLDLKYTKENYSISRYPMSSFTICGELCNTFEEAWGIF